VSPPRILFVLGKGGVGRSTVSAALGLAASRRGERVLVFEWTIMDPISPWFGLAPASSTPVEVAPGLAVTSYSLDEALRAYFVDHLGFERFYRRVVRSGAVHALVEAAPGIGELLFLGTLWWMTTLAPEEAGLDFDRIIVDAPATGHGGSILTMPETLRNMRPGGLLCREVERVTAMIADPTWTGAVVVATPEDLAIEETLELLPRVTHALGRPPLVAFVNRAVAHLLDADAAALLAERLSPAAREAASALVDELDGRARGETRLSSVLAGRTQHGFLAFEDMLLARGTTNPREIVEALACATGAGTFTRGWL
jgi:hypothetical protein